MHLPFEMFRDRIKMKVDEIVNGSNRLFTTAVDPDELYDLYLNSFPVGTNTIYRKRLEFDCSACRHFIKRIGGLVSLKNGEIDTIWNVKISDERYQAVCDALDAFVRSKPITGIYVTSDTRMQVGTDYSIEYKQETDETTRFYHLFTILPSICLCGRRESPESIMGEARSSHDVFKRALDEITESALDDVLALIEENNLHRGLEKKTLIVNFKKEQDAYKKLETPEAKERFVWERSVIVGPAITHFRNDVIGTLLVDLSSGMDLEKAVKAYETKVGGENYRRPKAIYTQRQLDAAKKEIEELGYNDSLLRRFATLTDISVRNLLFADRDVKDTIRTSGVDALMASMEQGIAINPNRFNGVPSIPMLQFRQEMLPGVKKIDLFFSNDLSRNMVSLIAPQVKNAKSMFTWDNNMSWAYAGNMATSSMKMNVKNAGGNVDGDLRFSIQWNDEPPYRDNNSDLDAHCILPHPIFNRVGDKVRISSSCDGEIYFGSKQDVYYRSGGSLDVDIQRPFYEVPDGPSVENIVFPDRARMPIGRYVFYVHNYQKREGTTGFKAEIEFNGQIYSYHYPAALKQGEAILVATVTLDENRNFTINHILDSNATVSSREVWGVTTNQFIPVSAIMFSPNYWGVPEDDHNHGAKHTFFFLKDCVNPERPNPFFNEFLNSDFKNHKRFMEALGARAAVETVPNQLSGVGFSETQRAEVILKIDGERVVKVKV